MGETDGWGQAPSVRHATLLGRKEGDGWCLAPSVPAQAASATALAVSWSIKGLAARR